MSDKKEEFYWDSIDAIKKLIYTDESNISDKIQKELETYHITVDNKRDEFIDKLNDKYNLFCDEILKDCENYVFAVDKEKSKLEDSIKFYLKQSKSAHNKAKLLHLIWHYVALNGNMPISLKKVEKYMGKYYSYSDILNIYKENQRVQYFVIDEDMLDDNLLQLNDWISDERNFKP